jgi:hypothetical protein
MSDRSTPSRRLPELEPGEARRHAEDHLGHGDTDINTERATAYALLAIAAELATIRRELQSRRRKP